ncbi:MAG: oxidoreductase coenzyme F420-dependent protein [Actinomycetia bacterium]|nr:oxidoreductase coenzyme F420-dependent protein [Actinomycetes bacterium]
MRVAVIGTGPIGGTLGRAFARGGHQVVFGSRHPEGSSAAGDTGATVASAEAAVKGSEVVVLALPGTAVDEFLDAFGPLLADRLVVDATNRITAKAPNGLESLRDKAPGARYARAFSSLGLENFENPLYDGVPADLFFSSEVDDRDLVEQLVTAVGLRPVYLGAGQEGTVDGLLRLYFALAVEQGHGRHLAFRMLTDPA